MITFIRNAKENILADSGGCMFDTTIHILGKAIDLISGDSIIS